MTTPTLRTRTCIGLLTLAVSTASCASKSHYGGATDCGRPDAQLARWVHELAEQQAIGCPESPGLGATSCAGLRLSIERQALLCPSHAPTKMVSAVLAYDAGETAKAQQFLDAIFERPRSDPDAAMLRVRIAIDDGNLRFAQRFVQEQIRLAPSHAGLREVHAAALFLNHEYEAAQRTLIAAQNLGAPAWRVAYHLGLIEEALGQPELARQRYAEALQGNPDFAQARARLAALGGPPGR